MSPRCVDLVERCVYCIERCNCYHDIQEPAGHIGIGRQEARHGL